MQMYNNYFTPPNKKPTFLQVGLIRSEPTNLISPKLLKRFVRMDCIPFEYPLHTHLV